MPKVISKNRAVNKENHILEQVTTSLDDKRMFPRKAVGDSFRACYIFMSL